MDRFLKKVEGRMVESRYKYGSEVRRVVQLRVKSLGFRVYDLGFRNWILGFLIYNLGFRV